MAYRRRQGITRVSTFKEDLIYKNNNEKNENGSSDHSPNSAPASASASPSLAAQAIAARRDSTFFKLSLHNQDSATSYDNTTDEAGGFWGIVARKAKSILDDDDNMSQEFRTHNRESAHMPYNSTHSTAGQFYHPYHHSPEMSRKVENPTLRNGLDALTSSFNQIGDSIGNAWEFITPRNKVGFTYSNSSALLKYRDKQIGQVPIPAGKIKSDASTPMNLTLTVMADRLLADSNIYSDVIAGKLPLTTTTRIKGKARILSLFNIHLVSTSTCDLLININAIAGGGSIANQNCRYKTKL